MTTTLARRCTSGSAGRWRHDRAERQAEIRDPPAFASLLRLSDGETEAIDWSREGWVPAGMLTIVGGHGGV